MERETKTLTTKNQHVIVYHSYATGREARAIEQKYLGSVEIDMAGGVPNFKKMDTAAPFEAEKEAIKMLIKTVDGKNENVLDTVLDLPQVDYEEIVAALNEVTKKKI